MKTHKLLFIAGCSVTLIQTRLVLEWSAPGRAFFTMKPPADSTLNLKTGQLVELSLAINNDDPRYYFTGFIESLTEVQPGVYRIFARELAAVLNQRLPVSLRHCTPKQVLESLSKNTALSFKVEKSSWAEHRLSRFQHIGGGYMALDMIGELWRVNHYCWHQLPTPNVYVGSWERSIVGNKTIRLPTDLLSTVTSEGATLPIIPRLRPGIAIETEGSRHFVEQVQLTDDAMRVSWTPDLFKDKLRRLS